MNINGHHERFIQRCLDLATQGGKKVRPNPQVGAVLTYDNRIIGEGFHAFYGGDHAEVNCLNSVAQKDRQFIPKSTLYVSLEPCSFFGKTPACTDLIIRHQIPNVVISTTDPNPEVNGKGLEILRQSGISVTAGVLETMGKSLIRPFYINQLEQRPYVVLKIVKSSDHFIGRAGEKIWLSNAYTTLLSHRWRSETDAIMVGTNTVINDDPALTTCLYPGDNPLRIVLDRTNRIPGNRKIFDGSTETLIITGEMQQTKIPGLKYLRVDFQKKGFIHELLNELFREKIYHLLVEGGSSLIGSFLRESLWDEARVITTPQRLSSGIAAPNLTGRLMHQKAIGSDSCQIIANQQRLIYPV